MSHPEPQKLRDGLAWGQEAQTIINSAIKLLRDASATAAGLVELATDTETLALTDTTRAVTPGNLGALNASTTQEGLTEHATDAEYVAQTATDKAVVPSNFAARPVLSVHKNGTNQTGITSATQIDITWSTEVLDVGGYFASDVYTPPAGTYLMIAALAYTSANGVDTEQLDCRLVKNVTVEKRAYIARSGVVTEQVSGTWVVSANGTDAFKIAAFKAGAGDGTIAGATFDTYFQAFKL